MFNNGTLGRGLLLTIMFAAVGTLVLALWWKPFSVSPTPNVILITIDTLRADHLGVYGYARDTSPNLDKFARESVLFRRAYAPAPETNPSLSSLMTSYFPHETKVLAIYKRLQDGVETLAEVLQQHGWQTGAVISNSVLRRGSGFEQGFDEYDDQVTELKEKWTGPERDAKETTEAAIRWLRAHSDQPFFLWIHYMDPHVPYLPPTPYNGLFIEPLGENKTLNVLPQDQWVAGIPAYARLGDHTDFQYYLSQYDGEIRYLDHWLGEFLKEVRTRRLFERSLVVVTADHGEGMGEHDYYFSHAQYVYTGLVHVPLLLRLPGPARQGKQVDTPVSLIDVMPTILEHLNLHSSQPLRGQSLLHPEPKPILAVARRDPVQVTLISDGLKLNYSERETQLYDLEHDLYETSDLLVNGTDERVQLSQAMSKIAARLLVEDALQLGPAELWASTPDQIEKLKTLGYVQ